MLERERLSSQVSMPSFSSVTFLVETRPLPASLTKYTFSYPRIPPRAALCSTAPWRSRIPGQRQRNKRCFKQANRFDHMRHPLNGYAALLLPQPRRDTIGFVFQAYYLNPKLKAYENVMLPMYVNPKMAKGLKERAKELLTQLGLEERTDHYPKQMSAEGNTFRWTTCKTVRACQNRSSNRWRRCTCSTACPLPAK